MSSQMTADVSNYWIEVHEVQHLALHATIYTWAADRTPPGYVLDLGCEYGFGSLLIAQTNPKLQVLAMDLDLAVLQYTRHLSFNASIPRVNADAANLPIAAASLSGVYLINILHLVKEPQRVLSAVQRTLKSGGIAVISIPVMGAGEFIQELESEIKVQFPRVFYPQEIHGQIPSFSPQTFLLDQQDCIWIALCTKG